MPVFTTLSKKPEYLNFQQNEDTTCSLGARRLGHHGCGRVPGAVHEPVHQDRVHEGELLLLLQPQHQAVRFLRGGDGRGEGSSTNPVWNSEVV
ncbi:hypothetical protein CDAR_214061 [Caerostris darwini]|uniref:Uncharacterized protein n=1 Tax=Caerostris darwini TaxID=1538125 RepID=A0AAV4SI47_9ARAC|nr:hypothetical protein CDAR_214061 [Caerostris darwini]